MKRTFRSMMALAIAVVTLAACSSSDDASKYVADVTLPTGTENTEDADILVEAGATPQRIVSTDKKALKAGGLVLALAGAIVAPTDEVDSTREYELVAM